MKKQEIEQPVCFHPVWIFMTITLPQMVLLFLMYNAYSVFSSILNQEQSYLWRSFAIVFIALLLIYSLYGLRCWKIRQPVSALISPMIFATYIPLIYFFMVHFNELIAGNVPRWMTSDTRFIYYVGSFIMPGFIYALAIGIIKLTPLKKKNKASFSFLSAAAIPLAWYGFFTLIAPLFRNIRIDISTHVISILVISSIVFFFFFLFRFLLIIARKTGRFTNLFGFTGRLITTLILPLTGLIVYEIVLCHFQYSIYREAHNMIGDFSHPLFYGLAVLNGLVLTLPDLQVPSHRLILFTLRVLCFPFTLYFCLVFLPFLPLSVAVILYFGTGLLMQAPLILAFVHTKILFNDYLFLQQHFTKVRIWGIVVLMLSVLPTCISLNNYLDRYELHRTLDYVFDQTRESESNKIRLRRVLNTLESTKWKTPFLTQYYDWLVLDNMRLPQAKMDRIKKVFFNEGRSFKERATSIAGDPSVGISNLQHRTTREESSGTYHSTIELEITNQGNNMGEYATSFTIPDGVWISDYYLVIDGQKVAGRLMEKKAALWIYDRITSRKKDPGLLYYLDDNRVALRVFPVNGGETRKTGLQFIHKEPIELSIDRKKVELTIRESKKQVTNPINAPVLSPDGRTLFVSKSAKQRLPLIQRKPYMHFILDYSSSCENSKKNYPERIGRLVKERSLNVESAKVTFANYAQTTLSWQDDWQGKAAKYACEGGFFLDKVIKSIFINQYSSMSSNYPVIIVLSFDLDNAILPDLLDPYAFAVPETDSYYELTPTGLLKRHPLVSDPKSHGFQASAPFVRVWPEINHPRAYFKNDNQAATVLIPKQSIQHQSMNINDQWTNGLELWGATKQLLFEGKTKKNWSDLVRQSKQDRILNRFTAFTVLENQAQWEVLKRKEKTALAAQKSMSIDGSGENVRQMPEPPLALLLICLLLIMWFRQRRRNLSTPQ